MLRQTKEVLEFSQHRGIVVIIRAIIITIQYNDDEKNKQCDSAR